MLYCYIVTVIVKYFYNSVVLLYSNSNGQVFFIILLYCYIVTVIVKYFYNSVVLLYSNSNGQVFL